ncbi:MAG: hypothetical protein LW832_05355, partial [Parachlamydia sp.]|nr:hypothetical protein [Parachlamydia sp.]
LNSDADFTLTVKATATESSNNDANFLQSTLTVQVDAVADMPSLVVQAAQGNEDTAIALGISSALGDIDGSESLMIDITGVPAGAILSAGTNMGGGHWSLSSAQLAGLSITPPLNSDADFTLSVKATATESSNNDANFVQSTLTVQVDAVADAPSLIIQAAQGNEDTAITLDISSALADTDGSESLVIDITGVTSSAVLSAGTDMGGGHWRLTSAQLAGLTINPALNSDADFTLTVRATAKEAGNNNANFVQSTLTVQVDAVADAPSLIVQAAQGNEDTAIALDISSALGDIDGSESLMIDITGVPAGVILSAGTNMGGGHWSLSTAELAGLTITPPLNSDADFTLTVKATATESSNGDANFVQSTLVAQVNAVADAPILVVQAAQGNEDTAIALDISSALGDIDGSESLIIDITGVPAGATLSAGTNMGGGQWSLSTAQLVGLTITPPLNSDADFTLTVRATATESSNNNPNYIESTLTAQVDAVADAPSLIVQAAQGNEDTVIALDISSALGDIDGSESLIIDITGVPVGATLSAGTNMGGGHWSLSSAQLVGLTITPPLNSDADFTLTVKASATESSNNDASFTQTTVTVQVNAVADLPTLVVQAAVGNEDTAIALNINSSLTDVSESLFIDITNVPNGAILSNGTHLGGGHWRLSSGQLVGLTLTPALNSDVDFALSVKATSTEASNGSSSSALSSLAVQVNALADAPSLTTTPATGLANNPIPLNVTSSLVDVDGSETLSIEISNVPTGVVLSAGTNLGGGVWRLTPAQLVGLTVTPPNDSDFTLSVKAISKESSDGATQSTLRNLAVTVNPAVSLNPPNLGTAPALGNEDTAIPLNITASLNGNGALYVDITNVPLGAKLSAGTYIGNGRWRLMPAQLVDLKLTPALNSAQDFTLGITANATDGTTTKSTNGSLFVQVKAVADAPLLTASNVIGL